jgi:hypothetical protein
MMTQRMLLVMMALVVGSSCTAVPEKHLAQRKLAQAWQPIWFAEDEPLRLSARELADAGFKPWRPRKMPQRDTRIFETLHAKIGFMPEFNEYVVYAVDGRFFCVLNIGSQFSPEPGTYFTGSKVVTPAQGDPYTYSTPVAQGPLCVTGRFHSDGSIDFD